MNVQHVESLNDVVARITRIRVRETVPDRVLDAADEVELVDLTPADLMERLREGKVYVREQAQRALRHYFSPGNLTALRELALRRTAERVDEQMLSYMREHAIAGPWAAGERVIVCLDPSAAAANAVRAAKRTADGLDAELIALYVETDRHAALSEAEHGHLAETMRLAAELGAEVVTVPGRSVVEEVLAFARSRNATRVVVGKSRRSRWFELRHGSVVDELVRSGSGLAIEVAPSGDTSKVVTPDRLAAERAAHARPLSRGRAHHGAGDGGRHADRPAHRRCPTSRCSMSCPSWSRRRAMGWCRRSGSPA